MHSTQLSRAFQGAAHFLSMDDSVVEVHFSAVLKKVWLGRFPSLLKAAQAVALAQQKFAQQIAIHPGDLAKDKFAEELGSITEDQLVKSSLSNTGFLGVKKETDTWRKKRRVHHNDSLGCHPCTCAHDCRLTNITVGSIALPTYSIILISTHIFICCWVFACIYTLFLKNI